MARGLIKMAPLALIFALSGVFIQPTLAQRLVSKLSDQEISINSTFAGENMTLFGNVEPPIGQSQKTINGPFDIVITVQGPSVTRVVRRKERQLGVWLNARHVTFSSVPSFFHIMATGRLDNIATNATFSKLGITIESQIRGPDTTAETEVELFRKQLIRLMSETKMFGIDEHRVSFLSETFYTAQIILPANVPNGTYLAKTYVFKNGVVIDQRAERFFVRTTGVERFISKASRDFPLAYGVAVVLLALFTGWLGGVAFRR
ncbi:hypothetical protein MNBD_ALPHA12-1980 [hydrothermal vent metagenome]|uniref:Transmembrane protein co-occuring with sulfite exporter TauE/SafE n=1 Tax=hydrothermal vent metagenome TaxID=652676 RepID=A0A3B0TXZ2_9ZZZZ